MSEMYISGYKKIHKGIAIFKVVGLIKKPKKVKLLNIKSKNEFILLFKLAGKGGIFIQPNKSCIITNNNSNTKLSMLLIIEEKNSPTVAKKSAIT